MYNYAPITVKTAFFIPKMQNRAFFDWKSAIKVSGGTNGREFCDKEPSTPPLAIVAEGKIPA